MRILLADDQLLVAQSVRRLLADESGFSVAGIASSAAAALEAATNGVDVVVVDARLPGRPTSDLIRNLSSGGVRVICLDGDPSADRAAAALQAGAFGYVEKREPVESLVDAIRSAVAGEARIPPQYVGTVLARVASPPERRRNARAPGAALTRREREVLELLVGGRSIAGIGEHLFLSVHTIRGHVRGILRKLEVGSVAQAVALALRGPPSPP